MSDSWLTARTETNCCFELHILFEVVRTIHSTTSLHCISHCLFSSLTEQHDACCVFAHTSQCIFAFVDLVRRKRCNSNYRKWEWTQNTLIEKANKFAAMRMWERQREKESESKTSLDSLLEWFSLSVNRWFERRMILSMLFMYSDRNGSLKQGKWVKLFASPSWQRIRMLCCTRLMLVRSHTNRGLLQRGVVAQFEQQMRRISFNQRFCLWSGFLCSLF